MNMNLSQSKGYRKVQTSHLFFHFKSLKNKPMRWQNRNSNNSKYQNVASSAPPGNMKKVKSVCIQIISSKTEVSNKMASGQILQNKQKQYQLARSWCRNWSNWYDTTDYRSSTSPNVSRITNVRITLRMRYEELNPQQGYKACSKFC